MTTQTPTSTPGVTSESSKRRRLIPYLVLAAFSYLPSLLARPGWIAADTKQYLYLDPGKLLSSAWSMWNPDVALGTVTHQNIGYLFPMGPYYFVMAEAHVPIWIAQRLWMGTLFFAAGAGAYFLGRLFQFRRSGALAGAFVYMLTPFVLDYITRISAITMPWAALGWMLSFTILALRRPGWRFPALFALCVAIVGGVNATSILFVGIAPALFVLYDVLVTRAVAAKVAVATVAKIGALTAAVSLWWIAGLWAEGTYGINILKYTETIPTVTSTSLASETFRGLGYWFFYGRDASEPWTSGAGAYLHSLWVIALSFAIPAACVLAGCFIRWKYRAFAVWLLMAGIVFAVAAYPLEKPTPFGSALKAAATGSTVGLAMRSSNRVLPIAVLGLALMLGAFISSVRLHRPRLAHVLLGVTVVATCVNLLPLYNGTIVATNLARSSATLPSYVRQTADYLNSVHPGTRVLGLPGEDFAYYTFGTTEDSIWPGILNRPYVARQAVVQGEAGSANLIRAIDEAMQDGVLDPNSIAPVAALMSAGDVLLQSNLPTTRYGLNPPQATYLRMFNPTPNGLLSPASFGSVVVVKGIHRKIFSPAELAIPPGSPYPAPLMVYGVTSPRAILRAESAQQPILLSGDGEGILALANFGLLASNPTVDYSASLTATSPVLASALKNDATLVLSDSNIRRLDTWGSLNSTYGYPMTETEKPIVANPAEQALSPFSTADTATQTVAFYPGVRSIGATSYGNPITNDPESQPSNAFDGIATTAWVEGAYQRATGQYVDLKLAVPVTTNHLQFLQPSVAETGPRRVVGITITAGARVFHATLNASSIFQKDGPATGQGQVVSFPMTTFSHLRVAITSTNEPNLADFSNANAVGFSEITVPGATPIMESLRLPTDLLTNVGTSSIDRRLLITLNRLVLTAHPLVRTVDLPGPRQFSAMGTLRLNSDVSDSQINQLLGRSGPGASLNLPHGTAGDAYVIGTNSNSRLQQSFNSGSWSAIDGDPTTAWVPAVGPGDGQSMSISLNKAVTIHQLNMVLVNDGHHGLPTTIALSNGTTSEQITMPAIPPAPNSENGATSAVTVPVAVPLTGTNFSVTIVAKRAPKITDYSLFGPNSLPIGIAELGIPGVTAPTTSSFVNTGCRTDLLQVNGVAVPIAGSGSTADLLNGKGITFSTCSTTPISFQAGANTIIGAKDPSIPLTTDTVALGSAGGGAPLSITNGRFDLPPAQAAVPATVLHQSRTSVSATIEGTGAPTTLVFGQSLSSGWSLSIDGHRWSLSPRLVDGFANGWDLPAFPAGSVHHLVLTWSPQKTVDLALYASVIGLGLVLVLTLRRSRRLGFPTAALDVPTFWSRRRDLRSSGRPHLVAILVAIAIATFTTSWLALPAFALFGVVVARGRWGRAMSVALMTAGLAITTFSVAIGAHRWPWNILWPTHFGVANGCTWAVLAILFVDATIESSAIRHLEEAIDEDDDDLFELGDASDGGSGASAPLDDDPSHQPEREDSDGDEIANEDDALAPSTPEAPSLEPFAPGSSVALTAAAAGAAVTGSLGRSEGADVATGPSPQEEETALLRALTGLRRSVALFRAFRVEQTDPDFFYRTLAEDTAHQLSGYAPLFNRVIADVGGGPGYFSEAFEARGAHCILVEPEATPIPPRPADLPFSSYEERHDYAVLPGRLHPGRTIAGDGMRLPLPDGSVDIAFSSNVLEHVPDPAAFLDEALRITRPGGTIYCSYTVWRSPWGGHETSPWHFIGGEFAARRFEKKHGRPPGNKFGESLFKVTVKQGLDLALDRDDVSVTWAFPRYYPDWVSWIVKVPVLREFLTWNLLIILKKDVPASEPHEPSPPQRGPGRFQPQSHPR